MSAVFPRKVFWNHILLLERKPFPYFQPNYANVPLTHVCQSRASVGSFCIACVIFLRIKKLNQARNENQNVTDWACSGHVRCGCSRGGIIGAVGAHLVPVESGLLGSDVLVCHRSLGSLVVQQGEPGASSCWLCSLALGSSWLLSSG